MSIAEQRPACIFQTESVFFFDAVRHCHGIFRDDSALVECGVLRGDDFSPTGGAGAEENKRGECEKEAGGFHFE
jgi:hypothetical protein